MFWCLKKNPAKSSKWWERQLICRSALCKGLLNLTNNEITLFFFFSAGSAQTGFTTSCVCSNELGLQCKLKYDALKSGGDILLMAMVLLTTGVGADPLSMFHQARMVSSHTRSIHRQPLWQQWMLHLAMHEKAYGKRDIETSFRRFCVLRVHPGLVSSTLESSFVFLFLFT